MTANLGNKIELIRTPPSLFLNTRKLRKGLRRNWANNNMLAEAFKSRALL